MLTPRRSPRGPVLELGYEQVSNRAAVEIWLHHVSGGNILGWLITILINQTASKLVIFNERLEISMRTELAVDSEHAELVVDARASALHYVVAVFVGLENRRHSLFDRLPLVFGTIPEPVDIPRHLVLAVPLIQIDVFQHYSFGDVHARVDLHPQQSLALTTSAQSVFPVLVAANVASLTSKFESSTNVFNALSARWLRHRVWSPQCNPFARTALQI